MFYKLFWPLFYLCVFLFGIALGLSDFLEIRALVISR